MARLFMDRGGSEPECPRIEQRGGRGCLGRFARSFDHRGVRGTIFFAMAPPRTDTLTLRGDLAEVARADRWLRARCGTRGIEGDALYDLRLALDEILANVIRHGYGVGTNGAITISLQILVDRVRIEVSDAASPFNPLDVPPPDFDLHPNERPVGGLGVYLVRQLMDSVHYDYENGRNRLQFERGLRRP